METLNFKVGSKKVVVATIDYSELEMLQKVVRMQLLMRVKLY
jgi:hypothetical protein